MTAGFVGLQYSPQPQREHPAGFNTKGQQGTEALQSEDSARPKTQLPGSIVPERQVARTGRDRKLMNVKGGDIIQNGNCAKTFPGFAGDFLRILK